MGEEGVSWVRERSSFSQGVNSHQTVLMLSECSYKATGTSRGNAGPLLYLWGELDCFLSFKRANLEREPRKKGH